ncbi:MAG: flavin oxidoreductase/NADH oxidase [Syntrophorhabdales bacterium]|jgi:2,4-dienoyl-CoA reductase-like NADH-dependent reductase (Old Yellow Enzyme family)
MAQDARFHYKSLDELKADIARMGLDIPAQADVAPLFRPIDIGAKTVPSRLAISPMEGCDGTTDGSPSDLTRRRYRRFGAGGAGLVWFEATAVVNEGRANPRQLQINEGTRAHLEATLAEMTEAARAAGHSRPYAVIQLTHSGRYSRPGSAPAPIVAVPNAFLDAGRPHVRVISDDELAELEERFVIAAAAAAEAGFDAVDIKACHGYLMGELLTAHSREGRYGGSFENRTRALCSIVDRIRERLGDRLTLAVRLGAYDQMPHPYGWGTDKDDYRKPDYTEPTRLVRLLAAKGVKLFSISLGNPYYNPHLTRPYDIGGYTPPVHPLQGVGLILGAAKAMQAAAGEAVIMCAGISWLRQFSPNVAAGCVGAGWFKLAGFGRQAFANPDFADDIRKTGAIDPKKTCVTCSRCTTIMRDGGCAGCVVRDKKVYVPIYEKGREGKPQAESNRPAEHL